MALLSSPPYLASSLSRPIELEVVEFIIAQLKGYVFGSHKDDDAGCDRSRPTQYATRRCACSPQLTKATLAVQERPTLELHVAACAGIAPFRKPPNPFHRIHGAPFARLSHFQIQRGP